ncbi:ENTH/VHS domain containing protein [Dorcoceras hygrometricum]|uniref:ENTH/VHS domain containing protein n=1 Tax=Dorcoceras hygrometricum TaxID=472368 RepID=A0A2Z7CZ27_9LAMI|nr:ENTH/VHS domain containing protein [Dorcoceras hygrometricum]
MSLFDLQDVCIAIGSIATLDLPMVVDLIGIYGLKGPYRMLTMTNWFFQALSVIPRGSWGDVSRRSYHDPLGKSGIWPPPSLLSKSRRRRPPCAAAAAARLRRKIVFGQFDEENPFVLISSVLLVQADEGVSFLVMDRIGDIYRNLPKRADVIVTTIGARHKCQQVDWAVKMRIRPPEFETSICDAKYHVSLSSRLENRIGDIYRNLPRRADVIVTTVGARHKCQQEWITNFQAGTAAAPPHMAAPHRTHRSARYVHVTAGASSHVAHKMSALAASCLRNEADGWRRVLRHGGWPMSAGRARGGQRSLIARASCFARWASKLLSRAPLVARNFWSLAGQYAPMMAHDGAQLRRACRTKNS